MSKQHWIDDLIDYPTIAFAFFSLIGDVYVIRSTLKLKLMLKWQYGPSVRITNDYIIFHLIFMLAILDAFYIVGNASANCINWTSANTLCVVFGFYNQFFGLFSSLWRLLIPSYLFYLLITDSKHQKKSGDANNKTIAKNEIIFNMITLGIILLSFIGSIIPLIWDDRNSYSVLYNYSKNGINYGAECWVTGDFVLIFYSVLILGVLIDIIALVFAIYKYNQTKWYTNAYLLLIKRLSAWVFVFMVLRLVPFFDRVVYYIIDGYTAPLWLVLLHHYILASTGIANAAVWYFNRRVQASVGAGIGESSTKSGKLSDKNSKEITKKHRFNSKNKKNSGQNAKKPLIETEISETIDSKKDESEFELPTKQPTRWQSFDSQLSH